MEAGVTNKRVSSLQDVMDYIESPRLLKLLNYWNEKRAGRLAPARKDIDPSQIGDLLSCIYLVDFEEPDVFRYRVAGTEIAETFGFGNLKGKTLADFLSPETKKIVTGRWLQVVRKSAVVCMKGQIYNSMNRNAFGERLLLPLADDPDGPITGLLGMTLAKLGKGQGQDAGYASELIVCHLEKCPD